MSHTPPEPSDRHDSAENPNGWNRHDNSEPSNHQPGPPRYQSPQSSYRPGQQPYQPGQGPEAGEPVPSGQVPQAGQPAQGPQATQYGYVPQQHQQPGGYGQGPHGAAAPGEANFFKALFDLSFKNFITIRFAGVLFVVGMVFIVLTWLSLTIAAFADSAVGGLVVFFLGAVMTFVYIVFFRVMLEFYVAMVRTAQNTSILVDRQKN